MGGKGPLIPMVREGLQVGVGTGCQWIYLQPLLEGFVNVGTVMSPVMLFNRAWKKSDFGLPPCLQRQTAQVIVSRETFARVGIDILSHPITPRVQ